VEGWYRAYFVVVAFQRGDARLELVGDVQLVRVEEQQDDIAARREPLHHVDEVVAAVDALLLTRQNAGRVHECDLETRAAPSELSASPSELSASPSELLASPSELLASPSELLASPSELLASPSELLASPSELSASPSELLASPSELSASPSELSASPSELSASPSELFASPSELFACHPASLVAQVLGKGGGTSLSSSLLHCAHSNLDRNAVPNLVRPVNGLSLCTTTRWVNSKRNLVWDLIKPVSTSAFEF
jgi:hypothetical protein